MENKVFFNPDTQQPHIAYRGSTTVKDWVGNAKLGLGFKDEEAEKRIKLAETVKAKYGKAPDTYGHSRAGYLSEQAGERYGGKSYTFNKATLPSDVFKTIRPGQTDIRTDKDIVSSLSIAQRGGTRKTISSPLTSSVIGSHSVSQLQYANKPTLKSIVSNKIKSVLPKLSFR